MQHSDNLYLSAKSILDTELSPNQSIALGVSGGCDSMTLLSIVQKYYLENKFDPNNIHVLFCDHQTRKEIEQERHMVKKQSKNNTIAKFIYDKDTYDENSLRQRRHESFVNYCRKHDITTLGTGHHLDDRIEGTLLNLSRGARLSGILSIETLTSHFLDEKITILRPLIHHPKASLQAYCKNHNIPYSVDESNDNIETSQRNHIRKLLNPLVNPRRHKSFEYLYKILEQRNKTNISNTTTDNELSVISQDEYDIINVQSGNRTPNLLYKLYQYYNISINPRSTTLPRLAQQLNQQPGNKVLYHGLEIKAYTYASIIIQK